MLHCEGQITALGDSLYIIALEETPNTLSHRTIPRGGVGEISLDANPHRMTKQLALIHQNCVLSVPATNKLALSFMCKKTSLNTAGRHIHTLKLLKVRGLLKS